MHCTKALHYERRVAANPAAATGGGRKGLKYNAQAVRGVQRLQTNMPQHDGLRVKSLLLLLLLLVQLLLILLLLMLLLQLLLLLLLRLMLVVAPAAR